LLLLVTLDALIGEDLSHLLALAGGDLLDLALLAEACLLAPFPLALGPLVVTHRHAEAVGEKVRETKDDRHEPRELVA
jgi:hypothetical protein